MELHIYQIYFITTAIIIFSPGPSAILVASQGASHGLLRALICILGFASSAVIYFILSATGIVSLIIASHSIFILIKWLGVGYLLYLGCTAIFSKSGGLIITPDTKEKTAFTLYLQGFIVEVSNPKALLYFSAILPQFLDLSKPIFLQIIIMGLTTIVLQFIIYGAYAYMGERLTRGGIKAWVINSINKIAGGVLIFAAFKMSSVTIKS